MAGDFGGGRAASGPIEEENSMLRRTFLGLTAAAAIAVSAFSPAIAAGKTFYWISHGAPTDPVWTYFLAGAKQWEADTGNTVDGDRATSIG